MNMCALNMGVAIDNNTDISRLEDVHIHNRFWWMAKNLNDSQIVVLNNYTTRNLTGFQFGLSDWLQMTTCFVIWANIGMQFIPNAALGAGSGPAGFMVNSGVDCSNIALDVQSMYQATGFEISNSQFLGTIIIGAQNLGHLRFNNCNFFIRYDGAWNNQINDYAFIKRDPGLLSISNSTIDCQGATKPWWAIALQGGRLIVNNTEFIARLQGYGHIWASNNSVALVSNTFALVNDWRTFVENGSVIQESNLMNLF